MNEKKTTFESQLEDTWIQFASDSQIKVVILKGPWGIGKTYHWEHVFKKFKSHFQSVENYSYVSLFGIGSIDELKLDISANMTSLPHAQLGLLRQLFGWLCRCFSWVSDFKFRFKAIDSGETFKNLHKLLQFRRVKTCLICLDDFERREPTLSPSSILGLISLLKEKKDCKIILVLNEDRFASKEEDRFREYREKVVDLELNFNPSVEYNLKIVWKDSCPSEIAEIFKNQRVTNIRVIQKTRQIHEYFKQLLEKDYPYIFKIFQERIARLVIIRDLHPNEAPIAEIGGYKLNGNFEDEKRSNFLRPTGYVYREYDSMIIDYLKDGHLNIDYYQHLLLSNDIIQKKETVHRGLSDILMEFDYAMAIPQNKIATQLRNYLEDHWQLLDLADLVSSCERLMQIEEAVTEIEPLLEKSIAEFARKIKKRGGRYTFSMALRKYPEICQKVIAQISGEPTSENLGAMVQKLTGSSGWDEGDPQMLGAYSEDNIEEWLSNAPAEQRAPLCLEEIFERFGDLEEVKKFRIKVLSVVEGRFEDSPLHQLRIAGLRKSLI